MYRDTVFCVHTSNPTLLLNTYVCNDLLRARTLFPATFVEETVPNMSPSYSFGRLLWQAVITLGAGGMKCLAAG